MMGEYQPGCDGGAVEDVEKGSSYSQQISEAVETKVDQMSCQLYNLDVKVKHFFSQVHDALVIPQK